MIKDILNTIASLIEENAEVFAGESEKQLLQKVKVDSNCLSLLIFMHWMQKNK